MPEMILPILIPKHLERHNETLYFPEDECDTSHKKERLLYQGALNERKEKIVKCENVIKELKKKKNYLEQIVNNLLSESRIHEMGNKLNELQKEVIGLKGEIQNIKKKEKVIVINSISTKQAKKNIQELFNSGEVIYYSDIVEKLGIELKMVVKICNELIRDGIIKNEK